MGCEVGIDRLAPFTVDDDGAVDRAIFEVISDFADRDNRLHGYPELLREFLDGGFVGIVEAALLPVDGDEYPADRDIRRAPEESYRFADRDPRSDDIIDDYHPHAGLWGLTDKDAALAVVLDLFAVEGKGDIVTEIGERSRGGDRQRYTFIRWPKDQIAVEVVALHGGGIGPAQAADCSTGAELSSVDEVGRPPA